MCLAGMLASAKGTPCLNRNRRLLLWWSQQKKNVNNVNLQYDNSQSGRGPQGGGEHGRIAPPPWIRHWIRCNCLGVM